MKSKQQYAIDAKNRIRLLNLCPNLNDDSGIYFYTREDENGFRYAYVGQAVHIIQRSLSHLTGYQHIDLSIKKHGLYDAVKNPYGWKLNFLNFPVDALDEKEQYYIKQYALNGYQLRNKTGGSQGVGKSQIDDYRPAKGYRDGLTQGEKNMVKKLKPLFEKHLDVKPKCDRNHFDLKAYERFKELIWNENEVEE